MTPDMEQFDPEDMSVSLRTEVAFSEGLCNKVLFIRKQVMFATLRAKFGMLVEFCWTDIFTEYLQQLVENYWNAKVTEK